jgi:hypothetical protein
VWKWAEDVVFGVPKPAIQNNLSIFTPYSSAEGPCSNITVDNTGNDFTPDAMDAKKAYEAMVKKLVQCNAKPATAPPATTTTTTTTTFKPETNAMAEADARYVASKNRRKPRDLGLGYDTVDAELQINIANKANGNVETFFQDSSMNSDGRQAAQMALGEQLVNLRMMLRCFRDVYPQYDNLENRDGSGFYYSKVFQFQKEYQNTSGFYTDYLNYLSYMYRFFRGGYRYKFIPDDISNTNSISTSLTFNVNQYNDIFTGPTHVTFPSLNPFHEVTVPYYSEYRRLPVSVDDDIPSLEVVLNLNKPSESSPQVRIMRAGNDDFTFGWLMGTPPIYQGLVVTPKCYDYVAKS